MFYSCWRDKWEACFFKTLNTIQNTNPKGKSKRQIQIQNTKDKIQKTKGRKQKTIPYIKRGL